MDRNGEKRTMRNVMMAKGAHTVVNKCAGYSPGSMC